MVLFVGCAQGRRWSDGLHQAVEAKEGLPIQNETVTLASISYQNFFLQVPNPARPPVFDVLPLSPMNSLPLRGA